MLGKGIRRWCDQQDDDDTASLDTDEEQDLQKQQRDSQAREEDEYLTGGAFVAPFATKFDPFSDIHTSSNHTEPLRPDQRWLGLNRRAGIGIVPKTSPDVSQAILAKVASQRATAQQSEDFRTRIAHEHAQRHTANLLSRARKTLIQLDQSSSISYSPLWLDGDLYHLLSGHISQSSSESIDEKMQRDASFKQAVELLQLAFSSQDEKQVQEAKTFIDLDKGAQLELLLGRLRSAHCYCLFCGCQYRDTDELASLCPGVTEDDHD